MNILYLTNHLDIGGITSYILTLSLEMKKRGHSVYLASFGGVKLKRFLDEGIKYIPIPINTKQELSPKILLSRFILAKFIKNNNIQILHSNSRTTQVLGCLLKKRAKIQHIWTCHGFFKTRFHRRIFPCWPDRTIAISEQVKEHLTRDFRLDERNIAVINNGIDVDSFLMLDRQRAILKKKELGLGDGPVIGIIARLSDVKGHVYLIQAMKSVLGLEPQARLLIVGEGKMEKDLVNLVRSLGIEGKVIFLPEVQDTRDVLPIIDLFVMPSLKEGLGLALMEAMASGIAVIGSNIGGIKSLIEHGVSGLLVEPADVRGLTKAIINLLKDPDKRNSLGQAAKKTIAERFSLSQMAKQTERVYLECLKN